MPTPVPVTVPSLVLINGTLIDGTGADPIEDAALISGGIFITPPGGYPIAVFGGNGKTISTTAEAPQAVGEMLNQGADMIKRIRGTLTKVDSLSRSFFDRTLTGTVR